MDADLLLVGRIKFDPHADPFEPDAAFIALLAKMVIMAFHCGIVAAHQLRQRGAKAAHGVEADPHGNQRHENGCRQQDGGKPVHIAGRKMRRLKIDYGGGCQFRPIVTSLHRHPELVSGSLWVWRFLEEMLKRVQHDEFGEVG